MGSARLPNGEPPPPSRATDLLLKFRCVPVSSAWVCLLRTAATRSRNGSCALNGCRGRGVVVVQGVDAAVPHGVLRPAGWRARHTQPRAAPGSGVTALPGVPSALLHGRTVDGGFANHQLVRGHSSSMSSAGTRCLPSGCCTLPVGKGRQGVVTPCPSEAGVEE
eukprot:291568-Chlamydomonas_euryale.AAC.1